MVKLTAAGVVLALLVASPTPALAAGDDVTTLETQLSRDTSELSTSDCAAACKALGSIRRAADRICELEPGPRCEAARKKANDATKRVRDACPECAIAAAPLPAPEPERAATPQNAPPPPAPSDKAEVYAEKRGGGCRSCTTVDLRTDRGELAGDLALVALVAGLVLRNRRRRV